MRLLDRRSFFGMAGAAGVSLSSGLMRGQASAADSQASDFSFLFLTDTHLQPELDAAHGCEQCFHKARTIKSDFAIQGGDHVFDALGVSRLRAASLFDLYQKTEQDLGMKIYHTLGNHDCLGVYPASGLLPTDPLYGKRMFEQRYGKTYYSFDHKSVHFVVLDSIGLTEDRAYEGRVDDSQLSWLAADLRAVPVAAPIIVVTHIPLVTAFDAYVPEPAVAPKRHALRVANAYQVITLFEGRNVLGVLQGHTHVNETVTWRGVPYITSGAVCGNWWHGTRLGIPEGFTVVRVADGKLSTRYETFGFRSVDPRNT